MKILSCHVKSITPFNDAVYQVMLVPSEPVGFKAGQYLSVIMSKDDKRPFSIASAPHSMDIELHIGAAVAESYPMQVVEKLKQCQDDAQPIEVEIPAGDAHLRHDSSRPRLLIAGGTGFSYVKSMVEHQIEQQCDTKTILYWGCRNQDAMYYQSQAECWHEQHPWLTFIPVIEDADCNWSGKTANLLEQVKHDFTDVSDYDIYIAGRFDMAAAARELFRTMKLNEAHLYGDAFAFIPK